MLDREAMRGCALPLLNSPAQRSLARCIRASAPALCGLPLFLSIAIAAPRPVLPDPTGAAVQVETLSLPIGAELVTIFGVMPGSSTLEQRKIPLITVLRDTLGDTDPDNDRLRYVWVHTSPRPTLLQHGAALVPFFYFRPDLGKNADKVPGPVIDLAATANPVWTALAASLTQVVALDPTGPWIRSSSRSYRTNLGDRRRQQLAQALAILWDLQAAPGIKSTLTDAEMAELAVRLFLAGEPLGGLVSPRKLPEAYVNQRTRTTETRGHNWELLRQRAEANGLFFEPFGVNGEPTHAVLWIAKADAAEKHAFDSHFLNIANPYGDARLLKWTGYTEERDLNGRTLELIPLALYSLDYPKVPLVLADFRSSQTPKQREMIRRAATDTLSGVFGISKWGNWPYLTGSFAWNFVRTRHGATSDRAARIMAYSEAREWVSLDPALDPRLRAELLKRLEMLSTNPLEIGIADQADIARRQHAALLKYAGDPQGLLARIQHDRHAEVHRSQEERSSVDLISELDRKRRVQRERRFLEEVASSGPQADVVWNTDRIKYAVNELVQNGLDQKSALLVQRIRMLATDSDTRDACDRAIESFDAIAGQ